MIFTSLGLLVVAAGLLLAGIAKSSVALLTLSLVVTVAAGAMLILLSAAAKRLPGATAAPGPMAAFAGPAPAGAAMPGQPMVMYVPMQATTMPPTTVLPTVAPDGGNGHGNGDAPPVVGYETMTAVQVVRLVDSGALTNDQLRALLEYERGHAAREAVVQGLEAQLA